MVPAFLRSLLLPLHVLQLGSTAKSFRDNPVLGSPTLNRRGLHIMRRRLAARIAARRRARLAALVPPEDREAFLRDGFLVKPDFLPAEAFAALRAEVMAREAAARESLDGYTLTRLIPLDPIAMAGMPATRAALLGPRYLGLHAFIGAYARRPYLYVQSIFSGVRQAPPDVQSHFHVDTFHPTVKSWLLLTPVAAEEAGFTYVPGSHLATRRREAWERRVSVTAATQGDRLTAEGSFRIEEAMIRRLGYPAPIKLAAGPNTLIIADTSGFHRRGLSASYACRISIWAQSRSNPFIPWSGGDPVPGPLHGLGARAFGWLDALIKGARGRRNGWRSVGRRSPAAPPDGPHTPAEPALKAGTPAAPVMVQNSLRSGP
jgi:hypothetical protein